jgi:SAM-dependent methyltransferase
VNGTIVQGQSLLGSDNPVFMDIIEGRFTTPSGNYFWQRKHQKVLKLFRHCVRQMEASASSPLTLIDVGCGQGTDLFRLYDALAGQRAQWQLMGVDADPTLLHLCQLKKDFLKADSVQFLTMDITKRLAFDNDSVDVLYCSEVIEHLCAPEGLLGEFKRILKPGGYLILTTPNEPNVFQRTYWSPSRRRKFDEQMAQLKQQSRPVTGEQANVFIFDHVSLHPLSEWHAILRQSGFALVTQERGAMCYGSTPFWDREWVMGVRFLAEASLDLFPVSWTAPLSDQLIALYQVQKA